MGAFARWYGRGGSQRCSRPWLRVQTATLDTRGSAHVIADRADMAKIVSVAMLFIGLALLWSVPLGGALFLAAAGLGLTTTSE